MLHVLSGNVWNIIKFPNFINFLIMSDYYFIMMIKIFGLVGSFIDLYFFLLYNG